MMIFVLNALPPFYSLPLSLSSPWYYNCTADANHIYFDFFVLFFKKNIYILILPV